MSRLTVLILLVLLTPCSAYAYLDPGTGSILVQALLAGLAVASAAVAASWTRIRRLFHRGARPDGAQLEPRQGTDEQDRPSS